MYLYYPKPIDAERISPPLKEKKKPLPSIILALHFLTIKDSL